MLEREREGERERERERERLQNNFLVPPMSGAKEWMGAKSREHDTCTVEPVLPRRQGSSLTLARLE